MCYHENRLKMPKMRGGKADEGCAYSLRKQCLSLLQPTKQIGYFQPIFSPASVCGADSRKSPSRGLSA